MNEELQKAIDEITEKMLADGKEPWEINAVIQKYLASKGVYKNETDQDDNVAKEQPKKEQQISDEQALINQNTLENQDWWNANSDLGKFDDYSQNEDGNWVDSTGKVVLYKQVFDDNIRPEPNETMSMIAPGDGTTYAWRGLASPERSRELAEQLGKQTESLQVGLKAIGLQNQDYNSDVLRARSIDLTEKTNKFFAINEQINKDDWQYNEDGSISYKGEDVEMSSLYGQATGQPITKENAAALGLSEEYLELIDILKEENDIQVAIDDRAKASGSSKVLQLTKDDLTYKENWVSDDLNANERLTSMGFEVIDEWVEAFAGKLTVKSVFDKTKEFVITTGGSVTQEEVDNLNKFLKENAYDFGTALDQHIVSTGLTEEQAEQARNTAVEQYADFDYRTEGYDETTQAIAAGMGVEDLLDEAARVIGWDSFKDWENSRGTEAQVTMLGQTGTMFYANKADSKLAIWNAAKDLYNNDPRFSFLKENGLNVRERFETVGSFGEGIVLPTFTDIGPLNVLSIDFRKEFLITNKEKQEQYFLENPEMKETFESTKEYFAKEDIIEQLDNFIKSENPEAVEEAKRLGITLPGLTDNQRQAIRNAPIEDLYTGGVLPEDLRNLLIQSGINANDVLNGISGADARVKQEMISIFENEEIGKYIEENIYDNIEARSGNWWSREEFQENLTDAAKERWVNLEEDKKDYVARYEELKGQYNDNVELLDQAIIDLDALRFDGLTAAEAIEKIKNGKYTTQEEVDQAIAKIKEIEDTYNSYYDKVKTYNRANQTYGKLLGKFGSDLQELNLDIEDMSWYKDVIGDRTALGFQIANGFANAVVELGQGFIEIGGIAFDAVNFIAGQVVGATIDPFFGTEYKEGLNEWYMDTWVGDRTAQKWIDEFQEEGILSPIIGESYEVQKPKSLEEIETAGDFGEWASLAITNQAPQILLMIATGGIANLATRGAMLTGSMSNATRAAVIQNFSLGTMGVNSMGTKYKSMREEQLLYGDDYNFLQMLAVSGITGAAEAITEKITFKALKGTTDNITGAFSSSARRQFLNDMKDGWGVAVKRQLFGRTREDFFKRSLHHGLDFIEESGSEAIATLAGNYADMTIGGNRNVHLWDGVLESAATGGLISASIKTPALFANMIAPFRGLDTQKALAQENAREQAEIDRLQKMLDSGTADPQAIQDARDNLADIYKRKAELIEIDIKRVDVLSNAEKKILIGVDKTMRNLADSYKRTRANDKLSDKEKENRLREIEANWESENKKKTEILERYPPNVVEKKYENYMQSVRRRAADFSKRTGVENRLLEGTTSQFEQYLEGKYDQQFDEAVANEQAILDDDSSTEEQKAIAQRNIDNINKFKAEQSKEGSREYGVMAPIIEDGKLSRYEMFINKETSVTDGKFNTASHEFLHTVLHNTIHSDPTIRGILGQNLMELALSDKAKWKSPEAQAKWLQTVMSYENTAIGEEVLTNLSQAIQDGDVSFDADTYGGRIREGFNRLLQRTGLARNIEFNTADDVKNFVVNYSKSIQGNYTNRTLQRSAAAGIGGALTLEVEGQTLSLAEAQKKAAKMRSEMSFSRAIDAATNANPDMLQKFDAFVKNDDGGRKYSSLEEFRRSPDFAEAAMEILEGRTLDGLIQQGMTELGLPGNALREFTRSAKENLQERFLKQFDPAKNESLFGWLTGVSGGAGRSQIYRAKGDVMKEYRESGRAETTSLDAMLDEDTGRTFADVTADTGAAEGGINMQETEGLTIFLQSINASPKLVNAINNVVTESNIDLQGLTYKDVKKLVVGKNATLKGVMNLIADEFGIPANKIVENKDLNSSQRAAGQQFIFNNAAALLEMLPEGQTQSGQATGVANTKLGKLYEKGERLRMSEGATAAGKFAQNKRTDVSVEEFLSLFGINPDGTVDNNRKHDGAIRALAVQAGMITANQTIRQQAIENETNPISMIALLGEGRGAMMFSKKGKPAASQIGKLIRSKINAGIFLGLSQDLANNVLSELSTIEEGGDANAKQKYAKAAIRGSVTATYGNLFTDQQVNSLVNAIYSIAMSNKLPKTDKGKVTRSEFMQRELDKLILDNETKVKLYFGTNVDTISLYNDTKRVKQHRGHAIAFHKKEVDRINKETNNEQEAGVAILESALMLRQQMSTAGKVGGRRAQLFLGKEFLQEIRKNTPGLEFTIKETVDKNNKKSYSIDYSKPITYKDQVLSITQADIELDTQSGPAVINQVIDDHFDNTGKVKAREAGVIKAREHLNRYVEFHVGLYNDGITDSSDLQMVAANLLSNMNPSLARAAMPKYVGEDLLPPDWKNMDKKSVKNWTKNNNKGRLKPVYEHMQPRVTVVLDLFHAHLFEGGVADVNAQFANYDVAVISDRMDKGLKTAKLNNSLAQGQDINDPSWMRYFNSATMETGEMVSLIGIGDNAGIDVGEGHKRVAAMLSAKQEAIKSAALANGLLFSKGARQGRQGITVLDFDDTLATTKSQVIVNAPDGSQFKLNAEEFAKRGADLLAEGNVFDFSEFNQVVKGQTAPLFNKALKLAGKFGTKDMFILTARAPESQPAIKQFLDANGLNIPTENIVGLGKSEASAKAEWIAGKIGEGYNDFYFADDAIQNVEAVQNMLDQYDVKSKVQQAKLNFSRRGPQRLSEIIDQGSTDLNQDFNTILEETKGVERQKRFSAAKAKKRGKGKGKFRFFLPPSAEDLKGLIYPMLGKGKVGEQHHAWFKENIFDPFSKGIRHLQMVTQAIANDIKELKKALPGVKGMLRTNIPGMEFTYQDAIRVYNWNRMGVNIPGLSQADLNTLVKAVNNDADLKAFADGVNSIMQQSVQGMMEPDNDWVAGTIESDISDAMKGARQVYLQQWKENVDIVFSQENLNKIEAVFGSNHREALEDMLYRMNTGSTRTFGSGRLMNGFTQWLNGSVGATMFFNARSAMLQMISNINFINWSDNNPLKAAAAFANQKQYWTDVAMIFNSPWLKQRRGGIGTDLNAAELLNDMKDSKNPMKTAIAFLLKIGFTPTQIADSLAIATGGATMYRNRINSYVDQGMSKAEAEAQAYEDMREIAEESQQSTREDKISQQQASPLGKIILAFQNVTMQYNRLMKRAAQDLINGRGDPKTHISKIIYYGAVQNLIFYGLQQGLFAMLFGDDEEDQMTEKKKVSLLNGMLDSLLRGSGIAGAAISTTKNVVLEFMEQNAKLEDDKFYTDFNEGAIILEALNLSPPIGIKARKLNSALQTWHYNDDIIKHMDKTDIDNPMYEALFNATEAITNAPLHRLYNKFMNIREAMDSDHELWKRIAMLGGWSRWSFGIQNQDVMTARDEIKEIKAAEAEERREQKKLEREIEKAEEERQVIEDNILDQEEKKEEGATEVQCAAVSRSGKRCSNAALPGENFCTIHMPVPQQQNEVQCSHVKKDGKRCKMKTKNKSGKCYYHD